MSSKMHVIIIIPVIRYITKEGKAFFCLLYSCFTIYIAFIVKVVQYSSQDTGLEGGPKNPSRAHQ